MDFNKKINLPNFRIKEFYSWFKKGGLGTSIRMGVFFLIGFLGSSLIKGTVTFELAAQGLISSIVWSTIISIAFYIAFRIMYRKVPKENF